MARKNPNCRFKIINYKETDLGREAYKLFDWHENSWRCVGTVMIIWDERQTYAGYSQMHFSKGMREEYGEWHRYKVNGKRELFSDLEKDLKKYGEKEIFID